MPIAFLDPNKILNQLELRPDMSAADFGCGAGGWTIPLAKRLKKGKIYGLVYGIDILEEPLSALESRLRSENLPNIQLIRSNLETEKGSTLKDKAVDLVLATNVLFQIEDKDVIMREIKRVLKKGGQVLVVDWLPDAPLGPKQGRMSPEQIKDLAREQGFDLKKEFKAGAYHYGFVFVKK